MTPIKLRPHHIPFLQKHIDNERNKDSAEYRKMAETHTSHFSKVYGPAGLAKINALVKDIIKDPHATIEVVNGPDAICDGCKFNPSCTQGNYDQVRRAYRAANWDAIGEGTPETADRETHKRMRLETGKHYPASEFFSSS